MRLFRKKRIFLDYAAGADNPSGIYMEGVLTRRKLDASRVKIARILKCQTRDVVFTSGGTESDNLAVIGVFEAAKEKIHTPHIVVSSIEHPAVLEAAREVKRRGGEITIVDTPDGVVNPTKVIEAIKENTVLVSIMYGNNETGAINPVPKIARLISEYRKKNEKKFPYIHTDASQVALYLPVDVSRLGVDLLTIDAAKIYGPKSTGLLIVRPGVEVRPMLLGGGQERGLRSGTENVSSIVEFAEALETAENNREKESKRISLLKQVFIDEIKGSFHGVIINTPKESLPNIVSVSFKGELAELLAIKLDKEGVAVSTGSSCDSNKNELDKDSLRFSFGRGTREKEILDSVRILRTVLL